MQTGFSPAQLADPEIADANSILRACVHCGFCNATCPTFTLLGDELDGPRGRIYLIKQMLEQERAPVAEEVLHIDRCLSCLSCMTTCPSGVNYMHLVDTARHHIERRYRRPWPARLLRGALGRVLPEPSLFRRALALARLLAPLARRLPGPPGRMAGLAPPRTATGQENKVPAPLPDHRSLAPGVTVYRAEGTRRYRVAMLAGCVQQTLAPAINEATVRLLARHGCDVAAVSAPACCGALATHLGQEARGRGHAAAMVRALAVLIDGDGLDAVILNASGCGTTVKDYGHLFRGDPALAGPAARVSAIARDVSEFLGAIGLRPPAIAAGLAVAYQSPCSLRHGQKVVGQPVALLGACGFEVSEPADPHLCCGSAGTYNILQGELADALRARKAAALNGLAPQIVASGNIGCMMQLAGALSCPVVHTVELLDWATGGPCPPALRAVGF